jgi:hypothetical protein
LLLWLAGPATLLPILSHTATFCNCDTARAHFPELVAFLLCFGLPLGLTLGLVGPRGAAWRVLSAAGASASGWRRSISTRGSPG